METPRQQERRLEAEALLRFLLDYTRSNGDTWGMITAAAQHFEVSHVAIIKRVRWLRQHRRIGRAYLQKIF